MTAITLSQAEQARLEALETIIAPRLEAWVSVGLALLEIRDSRLYRAEYPTFADYCDKRWKMGSSRAYQLMGAAPIAKALDVGAEVGEGVIRPMAGLSEDEAALVWRVVKETAPAGKPSAGHVKSVVEVLKQVVHTQAIDNGEGEDIPIQQATLIHVKAAVVEETYERMMRQRERLASLQSVPPITCQVTLTPELLACLPDETRLALAGAVGSAVKLSIRV